MPNSPTEPERESLASTYDSVRESYDRALSRGLEKLRRSLEAKGVSKIGPIWTDPPGPTATKRNAPDV